jgi:hypothetical protein
MAQVDVEAVVAWEWMAAAGLTAGRMEQERRLECLVLECLVLECLVPEWAPVAWAEEWEA